MAAKTGNISLVTSRCRSLLVTCFSELAMVNNSYFQLEFRCCLSHIHGYKYFRFRRPFPVVSRCCNRLESLAVVEVCVSARKWCHFVVQGLADDDEKSSKKSRIAFDEEKSASDIRLSTLAELIGDEEDEDEANRRASAAGKPWPPPASYHKETARWHSSLLRFKVRRHSPQV